MTIRDERASRRIDADQDRTLQLMTDEGLAGLLGKLLSAPRCRTYADGRLRCGFSHKSHFSETFRRVVGDAPAVSRRVKCSQVLEAQESDELNRKKSKDV
jgi:AraC-like DNA-binding protein